MKFIRKTFIPADNVEKDRAIFIVGEAKDGLTHYVAMVDLYHPEDRWVEEMTVSKVTPGANGAKPTLQGSFRQIGDNSEWNAAVACFNAAHVFDEFNYSEMEKNVIDQKLRAKLAPYGEWVWDRKKGIDQIPPDIASRIEQFKQKYMQELIESEQRANEEQN